MDISNKLKDCLEQKQMTQYALAKASGVTPAYVSQILSGAKTPTIETIEKFCAAIGITLAEFFSDIEESEHEVNQKSLRFDALHQLIEEVPEERREEVKRFLEFTIQQHKRTQE